MSQGRHPVSTLCGSCGTEVDMRFAGGEGPHSEQGVRPCCMRGGGAVMYVCVAGEAVYGIWGGGGGGVLRTRCHCISPRSRSMHTGTAFQTAKSGHALERFASRRC